MSWTMCTSGAAIAKAGANANSDIIASGPVLAAWSDQAEGSINSITRKNWTASFAALSSNLKPILEDLSSDMIATKIISYDMSGYTTGAEGRTMLNVLHDNIIRNITELKKMEIQEKF